MINCIILDDEPLAIKVIENFIKKIDFLNCLGTYSNANDSIAIINKGEVDLMFLDINMPFIDGVSFLKSLENPPKTIITSAHSEYAIESYDLDVVDYLLKPIPFKRFEKAINKVLKLEKEPKPKFPELDFVFVRVNKLNIKINYDDILVVESLKDYIKIVTKNKNFIVHTTLTSFTSSLPKSKFIRIHRSTTASINKIDVIDGSIAYIERKPYKIGGIYREAFKNLLVNF